MRKYVISLCLCIALLLAGCQLVPDEYISVAPHTDPYSQQDEEETTTVSNYTELKNTIFSYVLDGAEEIELTSNAYTGNIEEDFDIAYSYITQGNPTGAYLVESIKPEIVRAGSYFKLTLTINYRHTPAELEGARIVRGPSGVEAAIKSALEEYSEKFLMRVSGFKPMNFEEMVNQCFENNLTTVMEKPQLETTVYPDSGDLRIVDLQFTYRRATSELQGMQSAVNTIMSSAYGYVSYGQTELEKAMLLYSFLSERHAYTEEPSETPAYSLLYEGIADSRAFAAVYSAMCTQAGLRCSVVHGTKNGESYNWNIIELDSGTWHVDTFEDELNGLREMQLLTDVQMYGYEWDREAYPVCEGAPEPPAPAAEAQTPPQEETTPVEPDAPSEVPQPPADEDETPDDTQPPEENSGVADISS